MLKGRLGLEGARIAQGDRHGIIALGYGRLYVDSGTLKFATAGSPDLRPGLYDIPFQRLSTILLQPGTSITHDALRITARHGVGIVAMGEDGVRFYASMPAGPNHTTIARKHAKLWADPTKRLEAALKMYEIRFGDELPARDLNALRGIEGSRAKRMYEIIAQQYEIVWHGRRYNRADPTASDLPNQALNHVATAIEQAANVAVAVSGAIPQLGFIHEDPGHAFALDIADLFRDEVTVPVAFSSVKKFKQRRTMELESICRKEAGYAFRKQRIIPKMIDYIKEILELS